MPANASSCRLRIQIAFGRRILRLFWNASRSKEPHSIFILKREEGHAKQELCFTRIILKKGCIMTQKRNGKSGTPFYETN